MRDRIGIDRMLFGSDRTGTTLRVPQTEWVEMFRRLPETGARYGYPFSREDVDTLLGGNAQRIFALQPG
jgi:microsomal dipeptidase-like Zn-dependent dipeptidase